SAWAESYWMVVRKSGRVALARTKVTSRAALKRSSPKPVPRSCRRGRTIARPAARSRGGAADDDDLGAALGDGASAPLDFVPAPASNGTNPDDARRFIGPRAIAWRRSLNTATPITPALPGVPLRPAKLSPGLVNRNAATLDSDVRNPSIDTLENGSSTYPRWVRKSAMRPDTASRPSTESTTSTRSPELLVSRTS